MHPLVRDLYKRAILVGRDYPHPEGIEYVRRTWKAALRNPSNYSPHPEATPVERDKELRKAVGKGRFMVKEMVGVIQLKKYRAMKKRYYDGDYNDDRQQRYGEWLERGGTTTGGDDRK